MTSPVPAAPESGEQPYERTGGPVDDWFGLTYTNFMVFHRARLQSMPLEWQRRLVDLLEELSAAYADAPDPDFQVTTVVNRYVAELTTTELAALCITVEYLDGAENGNPVFFDELRNELDGHCLVVVPIPDPVPNYRHAYLAPDETAIAALRAARQAAASAGGVAASQPSSEASAS